MSVSIREYRDNDQELFRRFIEKLQDFVVTTDPIKRIRKLLGFGEVALKRSLKNLKEKNGKIYFAVDNEKVIGYVFGFVLDKQTEDNLLEVEPTQVGQIDDLYVDEEYRGKGIGKILIQKMEEYLKEQGCDSVWLEVFAPNKYAHDSYLKLGYMDREIGMLKKI